MLNEQRVARTPGSITQPSPTRSQNPGLATCHHSRTEAALNRHTAVPTLEHRILDASLKSFQRPWTSSPSFWISNYVTFVLGGERGVHHQGTFVSFEPKTLEQRWPLNTEMRRGSLTGNQWGNGVRVQGTGQNLLSADRCVKGCARLPVNKDQTAGMRRAALQDLDSVTRGHRALEPLTQ